MYGDGKLFWILPKYQFNYIIHRGFPLDTLDPREGQHLILANIGFIRIHWSGATLRPISTRDLSATALFKYYDEKFAWRQQLKQIG